jgi:hypothetical protein
VPAFQFQQVLAHSLQIPRGSELSWTATPGIAQVGPQGPPAPVASLRTKGAPLRGGSLLWTVMSVFKASGRKIPSNSFFYRLISLMQACAVEGGH